MESSITSPEIQFVNKAISSSDALLQFQNLTLIRELGGIAWIVFHLKGRPVNVVNREVLIEGEKMVAELERWIAEGRVKIALVCSGKPGTFIAGADIDQMYPNVDLQQAINASKSLQKLFTRISKLKAITVACINGPALGAGLELSLACDYRVCSDHPKTHLGLPEVKLGLIPGAGGTVRLPRLIGLSQALGLILAGSSVPSNIALQLGLVDQVIPGGPPKFYEESFLLGAKKFAVDVLTHGGTGKHALDRGIQDHLLNDWAFGRWIVAKKAVRSLDKLTRGKYPAPYLALDSAVHAMGVDIDTAMDYEANMFGKLAVSPESKALMAVYYLMESAKKVPKSLKLKSPLPKVEKIGIIGAGVMGAQIAAIAAGKGFAVFVRDISNEAIQAGKKILQTMFDDLVKKNRISARVRDSRLKAVTFSTSLDEFKNCHIVIEAAVENLQLKMKILQEVEQILSSSAVYATNTSSLSITALSKSSSRPGQVCGMHFFNPVQKMPLVEVIKGDATEDWCLSVIYQLALTLGKTPCVCRDGPGFIVNRILGIYMNEAGLLAQEGNSVTAIDKALVDFGMPMGPFRLMDEVGLDVAAHVSLILEAGLGVRFKQNPNFRKALIAQPKRLGKKTGAGFFLYDDNGKTDINTLNPDMTSEIQHLRSGSSAKLSSQKNIIDRCIMVSLQEACYILSEQICESAEILDLGVIFGTGFAPFKGGLLNYADQCGIPAIISRLKQLAGECGERFDPHPLLHKLTRDPSLFFPNRPHGMTPINNLPRSSIRRSNM